MDEKDEIIIQAGVRNRSSVSEHATNKNSFTPSSSVGTEVMSEEDDALKVESIQQEDVAKKDKNKKNSKASAVSDEENNLEDVPKMSLMQKVIIALAVLGIIGFVLYYQLVLA